jgi:hypothetical protein
MRFRLTDKITKKAKKVTMDLFDSAYRTMSVNPLPIA